MPAAPTAADRGRPAQRFEYAWEPIIAAGCTAFTPRESRAATVTLAAFRQAFRAGRDRRESSRRRIPEHRERGAHPAVRARPAAGRARTDHGRLRLAGQPGLR